MRNAQHHLRYGVCFMLIALLLCMTGCAQQDQIRQQLDSGYSALAAGQFDTAMTAADTVLASNSRGPGVAEAHYLRGRAFEDRAMHNPAQLNQDLQQARTEYASGLESAPLPPGVAANLHAGMANVAYHQDDYATALPEWGASLDNLPKDQDKVQALYRMGQSAQRLGRWDEADKYYSVVEEMAAGQPVAHAAAQRKGARAFFVQLATVASPKDASTMLAQLKAQGVSASASPDRSNPALTVIRFGPLSGYTQARSERQRFLAKYPNAIIVP